jgi:hypothetical protein
MPIFDNKNPKLLLELKQMYDAKSVLRTTYQGI